MKTVKFFTLGCKVNQYETQVIREGFIGAGYREIACGSKTKAGVYVINTCTVTHRADTDSLNLVRRLKRENSAAKIIVTGGLTELDEDRIKTTLASSLIVKNKYKAGIIDLLHGNKGSKHAFAGMGISDFSGHTRAFLKIQDGCNNFCSYCKVPLVRGSSKSKPLEQIIREARRLVDKGFKEIVLTGICLGSYGKDLVSKEGLIDVISCLERLQGLSRLRLSSIEAGDVSIALLDKISTSKIVCAHLHIPLQSGDNRILKLMRRSYCAGDFLSLIKKVKTRIPGVSITTDVLVGFPGETEVNFENTLRLIKKILPLKVHIFPYSRRPGTAASRDFKAELPPPVIKERMRRMVAIADKCSLLYKREFLGKGTSVLLEGRCKDDPACWEGYTANYIKVRVKSEKNLANRLVCVRLKKAAVDFVYAGKMKLLTN
jgi:threonylcarbamoyladenosine tRNA methylthiotransferase MtaB